MNIPKSNMSDVETEHTRLLQDDDDVPPSELKSLLSQTNFTGREIRGFYKYSSGSGSTSGIITRSDFASLCAENHLHGKGLIERMWVYFDKDGSGEISNFELVMGLNPLLRGSREQIADMFFDIYDLDGDGELTVAEIISVYSDMINISNQEAKVGLTSKQKKRITDFVENEKRLNKERGGRFDKQAFISAVTKLEGEAGSEKESLCSARSLLFIFLTAFFEVGTSFSLPAMGALSERIKYRFDITDSGIGTLTALYFLAAMIGPLVGGVLMDMIGPCPVVIIANIVVTLGAVFQATATVNTYWLLMLGRLLIGFGGEATPFTTLEVLGRLFPDHFGLMAGVRNLIQALSGFLAFLLLPMVADWASAYEDDDRGTTVALWFCALLGLVSTFSGVIVYLLMEKEKGSSVEEISDQATIVRAMRSFSKATAPKLPSGWEKWKLPSSFWYCAVGIKAQYLAPFAFTAFSIKIYSDKFGQSDEEASFLTGYISLLAGLLGPVLGPLSDAIGQRSITLFFATFLSTIGFTLLALASSGSSSTPVWIASTLFAIQYGFGDTVAYCSIRLIVGVSRAGIGYGVYGIIGNLIATVVPIGGGYILDMENGNDLVCWYFSVLLALGALCWVAVLAIEGTRSLMELPADKVIETADEDLQRAALVPIVGPKFSIVKKEYTRF